MKTIVIALLFAAALSAQAQAGGAPPRSQESLDAEIIRRLAASPIQIQDGKVNEIVIGRYVYSGLVVQLLRTDNYLQLINPTAPAKYGTLESSVGRDSITGQVRGLRLFSFDF